MKYVVKKEMPGAKIGDILEKNGGGSLCKYENTNLRVFLHYDLIQTALDQGFIKPYEEKPKRILSENVIKGLNLEAFKSGKSYIQQAIYQLEQAIIDLADNEAENE